MALQHRANIVEDSHFEAPSIDAYNFGTGDFTVSTMVTTRSGGMVMSRKSSEKGEGHGGYMLWIGADSRATFWISNGVRSYQIQSADTEILLGGCHTVAGVRSHGKMLLYIDGIQVATEDSGDGSPNMSVDAAGAKLLLGQTANPDAGVGQFVGTMMNASLWSKALDGEDLVEAMFARVDADVAGLQGYWTFDDDGKDASSHHNDTLGVGDVSYEPCFDCVWAEGANQYYFCQIDNLVESSGGTGGGFLHMRRHIRVPRGAPVLYASIMSGSDTPTFPVGVLVTITDPEGRRYTKDVNEDGLFVATRDGQPWALMVVDPLPGHWQFEVSGPSTTSFRFQAQTVPSDDVIGTMRGALNPLYGGYVALRSTAATSHAEAFGGFLDFLEKVAVAGLVGVTVAGVVVASGGTALPAVMAGVVAYGGTMLGQAVWSTSFDSDSVSGASRQMAGGGGFVVSPDTVLLGDADVAEDLATQLIYKRRNKKLYPAVALSPFNDKQKQLVRNELKRVRFKTALEGFSAGFVTVGGHGRPNYLTGWYVHGNDGPLEEILTTGKFEAAEAKEKIFHFFACSTGSDTKSGLGKALVNAGALAFFGYREPFAMTKNQYHVFCDCDIVIDKALLAGETADAAYAASWEAYTKAINRYIADGDAHSAALLEGNRDALVAPSTSAEYGERKAKLKLM